MITDARSGTLRQNRIKRASFLSFVPTSLRGVEIEADESITVLLEETGGALGALFSEMARFPQGKVENIVRAMAEWDAESSIEMAEPQLGIAGASLAARLDFRQPAGSPEQTVLHAEEIGNLTDAALYGIQRLAALPLSGRLIQELHGIAMYSARHENATPGWFRNSPVWIGEPNVTLSDADFVPPVVEDMNTLLTDLEQYMNEDAPDPLIRAALLHYQFETIHPFLDGNGRIGRLLVQLYLTEKRLLTGPILPLSRVLEQRQYQYFTALLAVQQTGNYEYWVRFFLSALRDAATEGLQKFTTLLKGMNFMKRQVTKQVQGYPTKDGGGVSLYRVLGNTTVEDFDPFLMLDSFDTNDPDAYSAGFPMHPHRGIETVSFFAHGQVRHRDNLGSEDVISDGELQYMTAGSGAIHEETILKSKRVCGLQLWLNLPAAEKMAEPQYHAIKRDEIKEIPIEGGTLRLLTGSYGGEQGYQTKHLPLDYYDIHLNAGGSITIPTDENRSCMVFTLKGAAKIGDAHIDEKTAAKLSNGDSVTITADGGNAEIMFMSSLPLNEPVSWGGPIVMNTPKELSEAFRELQNGTFIKTNLQS